MFNYLQNLNAYADAGKGTADHFANEAKATEAYYAKLYNYQNLNAYADAG